VPRKPPPVAAPAASLRAPPSPTSSPSPTTPAHPRDPVHL
jgi:hypothetical protein